VLYALPMPQLELCVTIYGNGVASFDPEAHKFALKEAKNTLAAPSPRGGAAMDYIHCKLEVFVPKEYVGKIVAALGESGWENRELRPLFFPLRK